jgi:nickel-dependent lactate racemase
MLGDAVVDAVAVVNHDARDEPGLAWMGRPGDDVPVWLNRRWVDADVRITTGFVEPHFFAGFSGGPKMVAPGLAGLETTLTLHDAARIGSPNARWGVTDGNPVHDGIRAIAEATGVDFALDVVLGADQRVAHAFGGRLARCTGRPASSPGGRRCGTSTGVSTSWSRPTPASRSTRTSTSRSRGCRLPRRS